MHMLFLDESNVPPNDLSKAKPYFSVGGVIMEENQWAGATEKLEAIKAEKDIKGEIKWHYFPMYNKSPQNPLLHLGVAERDEVRERVFSLISECRLTLLVAISHTADAVSSSYITDGDDLYFQCYKVLTERFQYYLQGQTQVESNNAWGIVVCDSRDPGHDRKLRNAHQTLIDGTASYGSRYSNLIEGLFLSPSHQSTGVQIADIVTGAVCYYYLTGKDKFFTPIRDAFRCDPRDGHILGWGIVHVPKVWTVLRTPGEVH